MIFRNLWTSVLYTSMGVLGYPGAFGAPADCTYPSLINATSDQLQDGLAKGCFTSVNLVKAYTERIYEVNSSLHMVLEINPDAVKIAQALDEERKRGSIRGPLHGLPILIKDMIGTKDKMNTTSGSYALLGAKVREDSTVAAKLRESGAIILGKTSLSEWASFRMNLSKMSFGWNARGGQTFAAYYPGQDPSGSSSGSGVSADLGLAFAALGTETIGSVIQPSQKNNIVGIKPSVGLVSRHMVIPVSQRQDTIGTMARTVKDAATVLQAIVGQDPKDNYTLDSPYAGGFPDYVAACNLSGLKDKRIGIPDNALYGSKYISDFVRSSFEAIIRELEASGAIIVRGANFTRFAESQSSNVSILVMSGDFVSGTANYLADLEANPNSLHSLEDIRTFTQQDPQEDYPTYDTGAWDLALQLGLNNTQPEFWQNYQEALRIAGEGGVLGAISRNKLDAVILPSTIAPDTPGTLGTPLISVPMGAFPDGTPIEKNERGNLIEQAPGIPLGISFLGEKWSEERLIGMAYAFEQRTKKRDQLRRITEPKTELRDIL